MSLYHICDYKLRLRMYITIIDKEYEGDVLFPEWPESDWQLTSSDPQDGYVFNIYDRKHE